MTGPITILALSAVAAWAPVEDPPIQGDALLLLVGEHRRHRGVEDLLHWMGASTDGTKPVEGRGVRIEWKSERVERLRFTLEGSGDDDLWPASVLFGLEAGRPRSEFGPESNWRPVGEGSDTYSAITARPVGSRLVEGYRVLASFRGDRLASFAVEHDPAEVWKQYSAIVRSEVKLSQFEAGHWTLLAGADILAGGDATVFAALLGWRPGQRTSESLGVRFALRGSRWISELELAPGIVGSRPFGLERDATNEAIEERIGPSEGLKPGGYLWRFFPPAAPPFEFQVGLPAPVNRAMTLRLPEKQHERWLEWMGDKRLVRGELRTGVAELWARALADSASLKGRAEVSEGLFGPRTWWQSTLPLAGVVGGSIHESSELDITPRRTARYVVRRLRHGTMEDAPRQLKFFEAALSKIVGERYELTKSDAEEGGAPRLTWSEPSEELFASGPELVVRPQAASGGLEIVVEVSVPLEEGR